MSIDVEGLDEEVLRSNDWARYRPKALVVEIHDPNRSTIHQHETVRFLAEQGFSLPSVLPLSAIFIRRND